MTIIKIILSGYYWAMAIHYCSKQNYGKSSFYLSKNEGLNLPTKLHRHYIHTYLLYSHVQGMLGNNNESLEYASMAKEILSKTDKFNKNDIGYLQLYATICSTKAVDALGVSEDCIKVSDSSYILGKVSKRYIELFPFEKKGA